MRRIRIPSCTPNPHLTPPYLGVDTTVNLNRAMMIASAPLGSPELNGVCAQGGLGRLNAEKAVILPHDLDHQLPIPATLRVRGGREAGNPASSVLPEEQQILREDSDHELPLIRDIQLLVNPFRVGVYVYLHAAPQSRGSGGLGQDDQSGGGWPRKRRYSLMTFRIS